MDKNGCHRIRITDHLNVYYVGPGFEEGGLPALFYFALSGEESLTLDPYNTPAVLLKNERIRIFSIDMPGHGEGFDNLLAMGFWANQFVLGKNIIESFVEDVCRTIDFLIDRGIVDISRIAVAGLSRGGFLAAHAAAVDVRIKIVLGFAPLTDLTVLKEFEELRADSFINRLALKSLVNQLFDKTIRFYVGNRDLRVGTDDCFRFIRTLADTGYENLFRSPSAELVVYPSIGHKGHGTPPHIFKEGIEWLKARLI